MTTVFYTNLDQEMMQETEKDMTDVHKKTTTEAGKSRWWLVNGKAISS